MRSFKSAACGIYLDSVSQTVCWQAILLCGLYSLFVQQAFGQNWPQGTGPKGNYTADGPEPPARWSVSTGENIAWKRDLPECGQGGVTVFGDRLFLTIKKPLTDAAQAAKAETADMVGLCLDAKTGKTLWQVPVPGKKPMQYALLFVSEPAPVADEKRVWFTNSSGGMVCVDHDGKEIWKRVFDVEMLHNAKSSQTCLVGNTIVHVELKDAPSEEKPQSNLGKNSGQGPWSYLRAYDAQTGKPLWTAEAGTSVHNTPVFGKLGDVPVVFHGRGGGHNPPEKPYGYSLTRADNGKTLWDYPTARATPIMLSGLDDRFAYPFVTGKLLALKLDSGKVEREYSLTEKATWYKWNAARKAYDTEADTRVDLLSGGHGSIHASLLVGRYMLFLAHNHPSVGRVNLDTGKVEYLHVPVQVERKPSAPDVTHWEKNGYVKPVPQNARGWAVDVDRRAHGNGWGHLYLPAPVAVNGKVYFVTMLGTVYVVDAGAKEFDGKALLWVGDLGPPVKTWTMAPITYSNGRLFTRTLREVICIGPKFE
jgi:outer membrane protein assembly factor BamB